MLIGCINVMCCVLSCHLYLEHGILSVNVLIGCVVSYVDRVH